MKYIKRKCKLCKMGKYSVKNMKIVQSEYKYDELSFIIKLSINEVLKQN